MTNEEFIKSLQGKKLIDYMSRILANDLSKYVDWDNWLPKERCSFSYKGAAANYVRKNGEKEPCTVVEENEVFGDKYCRIILYRTGQPPYLLDVNKEDIEYV